MVAKINKTVDESNKKIEEKILNLKQKQCESMKERS